MLLALLLVVTACSSEPRIDPKGNVKLYVSNESQHVDPVDVAIDIDGHTLVDDRFEGQEKVTPSFATYTLRLPWGWHTIVARSSDGKAELSKSFMVIGKRYIAVTYWYETGDNGTPVPRTFDMRIKWREIYFM